MYQLSSFDGKKKKKQSEETENKIGREAVGQLYRKAGRRLEQCPELKN